MGICDREVRRPLLGRSTTGHSIVSVGEFAGATGLADDAAAQYLIALKQHAALTAGRGLQTACNFKVDLAPVVARGFDFTGHSLAAVADLHGQLRTLTRRSAADPQAAVQKQMMDLQLLLLADHHGAIAVLVDHVPRLGLGAARL
jgi:hypothetical protein